MVHFKEKARYDYDDLLEIIRLLRSEDGCPWDKAQTHKSIRRGLLEEAYEAAEAIDNDDPVLLKEELGDVLRQVVFPADIESDAGRFTMDDVCDGVVKKLLFRHPHVFGDGREDSPESVLVSWDKLKRQEKGQKTVADSMDSVARSLPGLWRAEKLQKKASAAGFEWPDVQGALAKLEEEVSELRRAEKAGAPKSFLHNDLHIDLEKLRQGDYLLQCFAAYVDLADPAPGADPLVSVLEEIDIFKRLMAAYPEKIAPVYTAADLERNRAEGKLSAMLTVEEGGCCKGSLGVLRRLQELGVRMMTLTWNYPNELAAPNANPGGPLVANSETGLTEQGFAFLEEMEKLHITADVSHLSDKGFWDIANHSTRPFAASHSNCRALSPHNRNLTDEMIRALAEKGGIAGLNYCASFVDADSAHPKLCRSTVERLAKHAAHFKQVGGIEVISLGSDFDGIGGQRELETAADMPLLAEALRREGFTEDEVEAIYWRNAYRFFKNNL